MTNSSGNGAGESAVEVLAKFIPLLAVVVSIGIAVIGGVVNDPEMGPPFLKHLSNAKWFYVAGVIALAGGIVFVWQFRRRDETIRALLLVCVIVPLLVGVILAIALIPPRWQEAITRLVFVVIAAILPAAMYYLFLAAKRPSLFEEFVANLRRLGLVRPGMNQLELDAYLQKFEASFGIIPESSRERLISLISDGDSAGQQAVPSSAGGRLGQLVAFQAANLLSPSVLLPLALSTILIGIGWLLVLPPLPPNGSNASSVAATLMLYKDVTPVSFAFLGAYFFSLQMLFRRFVLSDLRPSAYVAVGQRIVLSVIAVWVMLAILDADVGAVLGPVTSAATGASLGDLSSVERNIATTTMVLAFLIGVFPRILWDFFIVALVKMTFAERYFRRMTPEMPLSLLDGLTIFHESRLEEEDIENVPNMATVDIVQMMLSTRFAPNRVIDWVDQAILYTALGPEGGPEAPDTQRAKLRHHGIRTASALIAAYEHAGAGAQGTNEVLAILDGKGRSPVRTLVDTLKTNPNLCLVIAWQSQKRGALQGREQDTPAGAAEETGNVAPMASAG